MPFKVIIAGGRDFKPNEQHFDYIKRMCSNYYDFDYLNQIGEGLQFVSGCAKGADKIPICLGNSYCVPVKKFPADWDSYGNAAGPIRNKQMAEYADALIAFWDGKSKGTKNMIEQAEKLGLKVKVVRYG
jgi:hypothetical protein